MFLYEVKARGSGFPSIQPRQLPSGHPRASRSELLWEDPAGSQPLPRLGLASKPLMCWSSFQGCLYVTSSWVVSAPLPRHGHLHFGPYPAVVTPSASGFISHTLRAPGEQSLCLTIADTVPEPRTVHGPWQSPADVGQADLATLFETRCSELNCVSSQVHTLNP